MKTTDLTVFLNQFLQIEKFSDYCPNGLQVEGKAEITSIVTGVTASMALLEAAKAAKADAILVHHGYFWRGENQAITGINQRRIKFLLENNLNLYAFHLPLDAHPSIGNNVMLGKVLGYEVAGYLDDKKMLPFATLSAPVSLNSVVENIASKTNRVPQVIGDLNKSVKTIAWCTGAAQQYIDVAIEKNINVFISGEISEQTVHASRESATSYIAAGHHVTERYGICALGEVLAQKFGVSHTFIDIDNPV